MPRLTLKAPLYVVSVSKKKDKLIKAFVFYKGTA